ncbi:unnamed protein product, partial [Owenia fusiformis]
MGPKSTPKQIKSNTTINNISKVKHGLVKKSCMTIQPPTASSAVAAALRGGAGQGSHPPRPPPPQEVTAAENAEGGEQFFQGNTADVITITHQEDRVNSPCPSSQQHAQVIPATEFRDMFSFIKDSIRDIQSDVANIRHEMVAQETRILRKMDEKVQTIQTDLRSELVSSTAALQDRIASIEQNISKSDSVAEEFRSIIVKNLEDTNKSDPIQVNDLIQGLGLKDIPVEHVSRKEKRQGGKYPGI